MCLRIVLPTSCLVPKYTATSIRRISSTTYVRFTKPVRCFRSVRYLWDFPFNRNWTTGCNAHLLLMEGRRWQSGRNLQLLLTVGLSDLWICNSKLCRRYLVNRSHSSMAISSWKPHLSNIFERALADNIVMKVGGVWLQKSLFWKLLGFS